MYESLAYTNPQDFPNRLTAAVNLLGAHGALIDQSIKNQNVIADKQKNDPLFALENDPSKLTGDNAPSAVAMLTKKLTDPTTAPQDLPRVQRLLGQAKMAANNSIAFDAAKDRAKQAVEDGDPKAAAQLLVSGLVAPSELVSSRRPSFAQQALTDAQQLDPKWNAQKADADFNVAKSPAAQQFFGSANSLLAGGGTLDQLAAQSQALPKSKFPKLNTVADYIGYNWGDPALAAYGATALGVADDYAKVMGGGTGSDTARLQVLQSLSAAQNPDQRAAVLQNVRNAVTSQRDSRIGSNPVMRQMYGGAPAASGAQQTANKSGAGKSAGVQVGQVVSIKGKQMKVTAVHPDGTFDAQ
jgi:hypothetical protein